MKLYKAALIIAAILSASVQTDAQSFYKSKLPVKPRKGVTVAGTVECDGRPVEGVAVSDGYEVTRTDRKGAYYLKSEKKNPQVFITVPSGYEALREGAVPQFWADFTEAPGIYERHDFRLSKVDQSRHAMILLTDMHLANQRNDVETFCGPYVDRLRLDVDSLKALGMPVYTMHLGDGAWDAYWYALDFPIGSLREALDKADYPTPFFNTMGNHDNDGATPNSPTTDMDAARPYMKAFGPRYYSFDIGGIHYVVLDNIEYKNEYKSKPKYPGISGSRNYNERVTEEQLDWLRKDLADIPKTTPIVIGMHCPMLRWKGFAEKAVPRMDKKSVEQLLEIVEPFEEVHTVSGHSHRQVITRLEGPKKRMDHNISGTSGAWWWTAAFGGKNLCPDGNPVGYELFFGDGDSLRWEHRTFEYSPDTQFWVWDMNKVKEYFANSGEYRAFRKYFPAWSDFSEVPANSVWIDLWAWDPEGTLKVTENGRELPVEPFLGENPMYNGTYPLQRTVWLNQYDEGWNKPKKTRLFRVQTATPDAPVTVTWTDPFGKSYTQTLKRPAKFGLKDF